MTAAGKITTARLVPGTRINLLRYEGHLTPTDRKTGIEVATVESIEARVVSRAGTGRRGYRDYAVVTDLGTFYWAASQTHRLAGDSAPQQQLERCATCGAVSHATTEHPEIDLTGDTRQDDERDFAEEAANQRVLDEAREEAEREDDQDVDGIVAAVSRHFDQPSAQLTVTKDEPHLDNARSNFAHLAQHASTEGGRRYWAAKLAELS